MNIALYRYSLLITLTLMIFFGLYMLIARYPDKEKASNFILSRRLMGTALLILATNYAIHIVWGIRFTDKNATILLNLVAYFICYWLFSSALMTLLDKTYITKRRFLIHILLWLVYAAIAVILFISIKSTFTMAFAIAAFALILVIYGLFLSIRLLRTYSKAIKMFADTHSDDIGSYIRWMSVFTYWAIGFGISCGLLTFLPDKYVFIWILSAAPFYIYLFCCYQNYCFFYERVEDAFMEDMQTEEEEKNKTVNDPMMKDAPVYHTDIERRIGEWIKSEGYRKPGLTLNELSQQLCTNRTYLSEYINNVYKKSFRDWITDLRIEYAKNLMMGNPHNKIQDISDSSGFLSVSHFSRTFSEKEGCSPMRWRKKIINQEG